MRSLAIYLSTAICALGASPALGQVTYDQGSLQVSSLATAESPNPDVDRDTRNGPFISSTPERGDFPLMRESPVTAQTSDGTTMSASSDFTTTLAIDDAARTMVVRFESTSSTSGRGFGSAASFLGVVFNVSERSIVQVSGTYQISAMDDETNAFVHTRGTLEEQYVASEDPGTGTFSSSALINGEGSVVMRTRVDGVGSAHMDITLSISPASTALLWSMNDGDWEEPMNWEPQRAPGANDTTVFDRDAQYTVTIPTTDTGRAIIDRGDVTWAGTLLELTAGDELMPSLVVGQDTTDPTTLNLALGSLRSEYASIGHNANRTGTISVSGNAGWATTNVLTVGREGTGTLAIDENATVIADILRIGDSAESSGTVTVGSTPNATKQDGFVLEAGQTAVGLSGLGTVTVHNADISTGETILGVNNGSTGTMTLTTDETSPRWRLAGDLVVGNVGEGVLDVGPRYRISEIEGQPVAMRVAFGEGAIGAVQLQQPSMSIEGNITVGDLGEGTFVYVGPSEFGFIAGALIAGPNEENAPDDARGDVFFQGDGNLPDSPRVTFNGGTVVGGRGSGALTFTNGAHVETRGVAVGIGQGDGGSGTVVVDQSRWAISGGFLQIGNFVGGSAIPGVGQLVLISGEVDIAMAMALAEGSQIGGTGRIVSPESFIDNESNVSPGVTVSPFKRLPNPGLFESPVEVKYTKQDSTIGTLTFEGAVEFDGGSLTIEAESDAAFDILEVTGDANFTEADIEFVFLDGYLPQTGDELPFLTAANVTMDAATTFTYTGADPGFEFNVINLGGMLMFQAQSDAQPEGGEGEGEGEGETEGGCPAAASSGWGEPVPPGDVIIVCLTTALLLLSSRMRGDTPLRSNNSQ